jgi:cytoskeletal protein CcmA (bactofilin family)
VSDSRIDVNNHLDEMTLLLYVERQLNRDRAQEVSLHTQTCERCLTLLRALDRESRLLTRSMLEQDEPLPARIAEFRVHVKKSMQWIWGVVFALALLGIYALYTGYVEPWEQQLEQAGFGGTSLLSLVVFQGAFWKGWQSMFTLVELVAIISFAVFAFFLGRKYLKRATSLAIVFASLGLLAMVTTPVSAADFRKAESIEVAKDENIKGDLYAMGHRVQIEGTVDGDLFGFGEQVEVSGHVTGDVLCLCRSLRIDGPVDGNVRAFSNNITITSTVGRNVTTFADMTALDSAGKIGHSLTSFSNTVVLDGALGRDFLGFFKTATINGSIGGELRGKGGSLTLGKTASVDGKARFEGDTAPDVMTGAKLASPIEFVKEEHQAHAERGAGYYIWRVIWAGARILLGLVLISLMPIFGREAVESAERYGAALGLGVLVFFGVLIASFIACITVVGLLVGVSTFFLWLVAVFSSYVVVGGVVGRWILGKANDFWPAIGRMALGVLIVVIAADLPHIGFWIRFGIWIWGLGAIALALYRRIQPVIAPNIPSMPTGTIGTPLPPNTTVSPA